MNSEKYYLYIIPILPNKDYNVVLETSNWKEDKEATIHGDPFKYSTHTKEINFDNINWSCFFRKFPSPLNSVMIFVKCLDFNQEVKNEHLDNIFIKIINELNVIGLNIFYKYKFNVYPGGNYIDAEINGLKYSLLFSEKVMENEIHEVNLQYFILKLNHDQKLNNLIIDNIFTSISLNIIAHALEHQLLKNPKFVEKSDIIKSFWVYKTFLLTCPAARIFPKFFEYQISVINTWLDERQMWLTKNQNQLLEQIHSVEGGILILTFFVIIDVLFTIIFEITHLAWLAIFLALIMLFICSIINPFKKYMKNI